MEETLKQQPSNCLKIALVGPESTGKTTLAKQLATHFDTLWVSEYMREYLQEKWNTKREKCTRDDLLPIAEGQMKAENDASKLANKMLFCDTNLLEIKMYSQYYYNGFCPALIEKFAKENTYNLYFLTQIDTPWEADDLRDKPFDRESLFCIFENELKQQKLPYQIVDGTNTARFKKAVATIEKLVNNK